MLKEMKDNNVQMIDGALNLDHLVITDLAMHHARVVMVKEVVGVVTEVVVVGVVEDSLKSFQ